MSITLTSFGISNQLPDSLLSTYSQALPLAIAFGGQIVDMTPPGATETKSQGETRGYWGIDTGAPLGPENVALLLATMTATGAWAKDSAGRHYWVAGPAPLPPPTGPVSPPQAGTGSFMPSAAPTTTDVLAAIADLKQSILTALAEKA